MSKETKNTAEIEITTIKMIIDGQSQNVIVGENIESKRASDAMQRRGFVDSLLIGGQKQKVQVYVDNGEYHLLNGFCRSAVLSAHKREIQAELVEKPTNILATQAMYNQQKGTSITVLKPAIMEMLKTASRKATARHFEISEKSVNEIIGIDSLPNDVQESGATFKNKVYLSKNKSFLDNLTDEDYVLPYKELVEKVTVLKEARKNENRLEKEKGKKILEYTLNEDKLHNFAQMILDNEIERLNVQQVKEAICDVEISYEEE